MPELPEVETVRRGLEPAMTGKRILAADIRCEGLRFAFPMRLAERLEGARVDGLERRSKYILAPLSSGETMLLHLGMSGRILISGSDAAREMQGEFHHRHPAPERHDHVILDLEGGARVTFNDPRRFGALDLMTTGTEAAHPLLAKLGPEPLSNGFHAAGLAQALAGRKTPIKAALLDQRIVAGLGNIYVAEALWRAGIAPTRAAGRIAPARIAALVVAIREVLADAIAAGGSSLRDFRQADGELGYFQHAFAVYDRAGSPCQRAGCGGDIRRIVQAGRSTYWCPACQR